MTAIDLQRRTFGDELFGLVAAALTAWTVLALRDVGLPRLRAGEDVSLVFRAYLIVGFPAALVVCSLLGAMTFQFLERRDLRSWHHAALAGGVIGLAVSGIAIVAAMYPRSITAFVWQTPFDASVGALAGIVAWFCAKSRAVRRARRNAKEAGA